MSVLPTAPEAGKRPFRMIKGISGPEDLADVTATAAEVNLMDGCTATTTELNLIDGVTATTTELNDLDTSLKSILFDDFLGTWLITDASQANLWSSTAGSGTANEIATTVAAALGGTITLTSANDDGSHAANASTFTSIELAYKANQGGLAIEARIAIDDISEAALFVGFTDVISTTVELPIFLVTTAIDSDATDACGVGYDVDGTTKQFFHGGVKNATDTTPAYSGAAPVDNTYFIVRVEVSAAGAVQGFINGTAIGVAVANAVTITTALCPSIVIANRSGNQVIATIDYIKVEQNR